MASTSMTDAPPTVSSVMVSCPTFGLRTPHVRFIQVEWQFAARRTTADFTKYHYVVSRLPAARDSEVRDLLLAPPVDNAFATLKETILHRVTPSEPQRLQELFHGTRHATRRPYP
ncbi:hypothetical protein HPB48_026543 [Haemaphysalis longicornis]|uniref:DUF7041 domain-containing protein n=1 Tax=Haemaphysalis longicornis TaxID=44386 RepID=A0A9J6H1D8_HAELO|nr:hypothetical protein HPB48_026543 [Haemaphysalis longicornis]